MWRHLLYFVATVGIALIAALLIVLVVEPRLAGNPLTGRGRQMSALMSLVLIGGCGYVMFCWLRYTAAGHGRFDH
jgi:hypothetical protein